MSLEDDEVVALRLMDVTAYRFGVTIAELRHSRSREACHARQVAMAAMRRTTTLSFPEMGRLFDRDHTTVVASVRRANRTPVLAAQVEAVVAALPGWRCRAEGAVRYMVVAVTYDIGSPRQVQRTESTCS